MGLLLLCPISCLINLNLWRCLLAITEEREPPLCRHCGINTAAKAGLSKLGFRMYKKYCNPCRFKVEYSEELRHKARAGLAKIKPDYFYYRSFKKDYCEICSFIAVDACQLDIHHKDNNHNNNEETNLMTVCANCHRLITQKLI